MIVMLVVGLTGQSGSGKTTVSEIFSKNGFHHVNCDLIARDVTSDGSQCLSDIVCEFSDAVLASNNVLNRRALGSIVFSDRDKLNRLNEIIFPYIIRQLEDTITILKKENVSLVLLDAPTLFESGADKLCDIVVAVVADYQLRLNRIIERDSISQKEAENRLLSQHTTEFFIDNSDFVIDNSFDSDTLKKSTKQTILLIQERLKCNGNSH